MKVETLPDNPALKVIVGEGVSRWEFILLPSEARQLRDELTWVLMEADPEASKPLPWPSLNPPRSKP